MQNLGPSRHLWLGPVVLVSGMRITRTAAWAVCAALLFAAGGQASAADVAAGRTLAGACAACHGADGVSQIELTPSLAGQPDEFLQWQIVYFRSGVRKSEVMGPIAEALSNQDIRNLGAYYASLPPPQPAGRGGRGGGAPASGRGGN